jgi:ribosome modulation factor
MAKSAYQQGYEASAIPPPEQPNCPYQEGDPKHDEWWDGFGDSTEDRIRWNGGEEDIALEEK